MGTKRTVDYELSARELNWNNKGKRQLKPKASVLFHLYTDMDDDFEKSNGTIYLEMRDVYFCASNNNATIGIPPDLWNRIVAIGPVRVRKGHHPDFPQQQPSKPRKRNRRAHVVDAS